MAVIKKGSKELLTEVINNGICVYCGACSAACPYLRASNGQIVRLDSCTLEEGQCYQYCARTRLDIQGVNKRLFGVEYSPTEFGVSRSVVLARSTDPTIQAKAQDGGAVTALLATALETGIVQGVVSTRMSEERIPSGFIAHNKAELLNSAGSSYEPSPVLATLNQIAKDSRESLAVVGLGCQLTALAKMRTAPPRNRVNIDNVKLTIGLFCGWSLANGFHKYLARQVNLKDVVKFDIPHHPGHSFDVYLKSGEKKSIDLDEIREYINPACSYCWDMTAEYSDISVGSGRAAYHGWNTVIVRTRAGAELLEAAVKKGNIEIQPAPADNLQSLKRASMNKKKRALNSIINKIGSKDKLLYLEDLRPWLEQFLD